MRIRKDYKEQMDFVLDYVKFGASKHRKKFDRMCELTIAQEKAADQELRQYILAKYATNGRKNKGGGGIQ